MEIIIDSERNGGNRTRIIITKGNNEHVMEYSINNIRYTDVENGRNVARTLQTKVTKIL